MFDCRLIVADRKCSDCSATNHDHFKRERFEDNPHFAARQKITSKDRYQNEDNTEKTDHLACFPF